MTSLKEAESLSSEQELSFLQNLLESKEINALVNVHSKVAKVVKDEKCAPIMSSSMQVSTVNFIDFRMEINFDSPFNKFVKVALEVLEQLSQRCHISPTCKDLFQLLQTPHIQVCSSLFHYKTSFEHWIDFLFGCRVCSLLMIQLLRRTSIHICPTFPSKSTKTKKRSKLFSSSKATSHWYVSQFRFTNSIFPHILTDALHGFLLLQLSYFTTISSQSSTIFLVFISILY